MMSAFPGVIPRSGEEFLVLFSLLRLFFHQNFGTRNSGIIFLKLLKEALLLNKACSNVTLNMKPLALVFLINSQLWYNKYRNFAQSCISDTVEYFLGRKIS